MKIIWLMIRFKVVSIIFIFTSLLFLSSAPMMLMLVFPRVATEPVLAMWENKN